MPQRKKAGGPYRLLARAFAKLHLAVERFQRRLPETVVLHGAVPGVWLAEGVYIAGRLLEEAHRTIRTVVVEPGPYSVASSSCPNILLGFVDQFNLSA